MATPPEADIPAAPIDARTARDLAAARQLGYAPDVFAKAMERRFQGAGYDAWTNPSKLAAIGMTRRIAAESMMIQSFVNVVRVMVVGDFCPTPTFSGVDRKRDAEALAEMWAAWAQDPTANGGEDLPGLLRALVSSLVIDGRVFGILRRHDDYTCGVAIMPLERDWLYDADEAGQVAYVINGREAINGVIRGDSGRIQGYVFYGAPTPTDVIEEKRYGDVPGMPNTTMLKRVVIPADQVLDLYSARNVADFEGNVSHLLPAMQMLKDVAGLDKSMVEAMDQAAVKGGFITSEQGQPTITKFMADNPGMPVPPAKMRRGGSIEELIPGQSFTNYDPKAPTGDMVKYRVDMVKNAAASLGIDAASITADISDVNFSSIRHGELRARVGFRSLQGDIERKVLRPALTRLIETAQLRGDISISAASRRKAVMTDWRHRAYDWVDPSADMQAQLLAIQLGVQSPQRLAAMMGVDYPTIIEELKEAAKDFEKAGIQFPAAPPPAPPAASIAGGAKPKPGGAKPVAKKPAKKKPAAG